ncbi:PHOsphatase [Mortierella sp. AM989]|nr:PHOsphatase [Mortierella sp. AM989]
MAARNPLWRRTPLNRSWQNIILSLFVIVFIAQLSAPTQAQAQSIANDDNILAAANPQGKKDSSPSLSWIQKHLGTKSPYPHGDKRASPLRDTPKGYELAQVHLVNRHGTRYPSSSKIIAYQKLAAKLGKTAVPGYEWLKTWPGGELYPVEQGNLLTPNGDSDLYQIGRRFGIRYKDFINRYPYDANTYDIRSSMKPRCTQSAYSFTEGFFQGHHTSVEVNGIKQDKSKRPPLQPVAISTLPAGLDKEIAIQDSCPRWVEKIKEDDNTVHEMEVYQKTFLPQLAERLTSLLSNGVSQVNVTTKDVESIYGICSYEVSVYNNDKTFCELLKRGGPVSESKNSSFVNFEISGDLDDYYVFGPVIPFNRHPGCFLGTNLANSIEAALTADPVIPEDDELGPSYYRGVFKFGHSETIFFLSTFLGLHNQTSVYLTGDMTPEQYAQRDFYTSKISPFSANIAFEVYRPKPSNAIRKRADSPKGLVRLLVNEDPTIIPGCGSTYFCEWDTFKQILQKQGAGCDYEACCVLDPADGQTCLSIDPLTRNY